MNPNNLDEQCNICYDHRFADELIKINKFINECNCIYTYHKSCLYKWINFCDKIVCPTCKKNSKKMQNYYTSERRIEVFVTNTPNPEASSIDKLVIHATNLAGKIINKLLKLGIECKVSFLSIIIFFVIFIVCAIVVVLILIPYFVCIGTKYIFIVIYTITKEFTNDCIECLLINFIITLCSIAHLKHKIT